MVITSMHSTPSSEFEKSSIGITVVELDRNEAKKYNTNDLFKSELKILARNSMNDAKTNGIIIEEIGGCDFLDIFTPGDF